MDFLVFCFLLFAVVAGDGVLDVLVDEGGGLLDPGPDTTSGGVGQVDLGERSERATHHVLHAVQDLAVLGQASALRGQRCDLCVQQRDAVDSADHHGAATDLGGGVSSGPKRINDVGGGGTGEGDQHSGWGGGGGPDASPEGLDDRVDGVR